MIDILLATYQGEKYISEQIDSILKQTYPHFHLYIRDDGSSDHTVAIVKQKIAQFPDKISLLPTHSKLGAIGNFSTLLDASKSHFVMFCDQDDVWFPEKIAITLECMQAMENEFGSQTPILVHTDLSVVNEQLKISHPSFWHYSNLQPKKFTTLNRLLTQNVVTGCTVMINRPLATLSSPFPQEACMHDWWLALVAAAFGKIGVIETPTMLYRQHGKNTLGAKPYHLKNYLKRWYKGQIPDYRQPRSRQAAHFYERYQDRCDPSIRNILEGYQDYCSPHFLRKRIALVRYGFYKSGFLRNLYEWLT